MYGPSAEKYSWVNLDLDIVYTSAVWLSIMREREVPARHLSTYLAEWMISHVHNDLIRRLWNMDGTTLETLTMTYLHSLEGLQIKAAWWLRWLPVLDDLYRRCTPASFSIRIRRIADPDRLLDWDAPPEISFTSDNYMQALHDIRKTATGQGEPGADDEMSESDEEARALGRNRRGFHEGPGGCRCRGHEGRSA